MPNPDIDWFPVEVGWLNEPVETAIVPPKAIYPILKAVADFVVQFIVKPSESLDTKSAASSIPKAAVIWIIHLVVTSIPWVSVVTAFVVKKFVLPLAVDDVAKPIPKDCAAPSKESVVFNAPKANNIPFGWKPIPLTDWFPVEVFELKLPTFTDKSVPPNAK